MKPNQLLEKWIGERMADSEFARLAAISKSHLSLILAGKRHPSWALADKFERITKGEIAIARWFRERRSPTGDGARAAR